MKTVNETLKMISKSSALLALTLVTACSNSQQNNTSALPVTSTVIPGAVIIDNTIGSGSSSITGGSTTTFKPASLSVMNEYVATHPLNNPSNFKINLNLSQAGSGRYGGTVTISYIDNGIQYSGVFNAGMGKNQSLKGMYDNDRLEADYNYWFTYENQLVFTGFFEDQYGAITITLVPQTTQPASGNDGEPILTGPYKGYVYFKNFAVTTAPHSPYRSCWYTYMGPYDCRSNVIQTKCGLFPGSEAGYKLLGTFSNIDTSAAFNIN